MFNPNHPERLKAAFRKGDILETSAVESLRNALSVARERYESNRVEMQTAADRCKADPEYVKAHEGGMVNPRIYQPMASQFARQVEEIDALIEWLDGPEDAMADGREIGEITLRRHFED